MNKNLLILAITLIISLGLLTGCCDVELKQGVYVTDDGLSSVTLTTDNEFAFVRHLATSYVPTGNYSINKGKLIIINFFFFYISLWGLLFFLHFCTIIAWFLRIIIDIILL